MFALRHIGPGIVLLISLLVIVFYYAVNRPQIQNAGMDIARKEALQTVKNLQGRLNSDFGKDASTYFPIEVFNAAARPETEGFYIFDADMMIRFAHRSRFVGMTLDETGLNYDASLLRATMANAGVAVGREIDPSYTNVLTGYAGLAKDNLDEVERWGIIYKIDFDRQLMELTNLASSPVELTIGLLAFVSFALSIFLRLYLDQRQKPLFDSLFALARGKRYEAENIKSGDEFSEITRHVAKITRRLVADRIRLEHLTTEAKRTANTRQKLLTGIGRDIRTPVNMVQGFMELLLEEKLPKNSKNHIRNALIATRNLASMSNDLFDLSKLHELGYRPKKEAACLNLIIQDIFDSVMPLAQMKGIKIHIDFSGEDAIWVQTDPLLLKGTMMALLGAAIQQSSENLVVLEVIAKPILDNKIETKLLIKGRFLPTLEAGQFFARDEIMQFQSFLGNDVLTHLLNEIADTYICHAADIDPVITEFGFDFTTTQARKDDDLTQLLPMLRTPKNMNILLVDHNYLNRVLYSAALQNKGHKIVVKDNAGDGISAIRDSLIYTEHSTFDLILLNLDMPDNASADFISHSQNIDQKNRAIPIIGMSAKQRADMADFRTLGLSGFMPLPFSMNELMLEISQVMGMRATLAQDKKENIKL